MEEVKLQEVINPLLNWFSKEGRILPWREGKEPYKIWISEIMLQQTKIEAVKKYYERFMQELPTIRDLAGAEEDKLLKLWEGLGYYNRARNLRKAAQIIEKEYDGKMPKSYEELIKLPGIGEYTAGAIASIAYDEKVPAVDGNVLRVVSRVLGSRDDVLLVETKKKMTEKIRKVMPEQAGKFNEAIMELGETICIPNGMPLCEKCPLKGSCIAEKEGLTMEIPVREKKIKRQVEEITVFLLYCGDKVAIQKREEKGLLAGMYEFPNKEQKMNKAEVEKQIEAEGMKIEEIAKGKKHKHVFSHKEWNMISYRIKVEKENEKFLWVKKEELEEKYALPTAFAVFNADEATCSKA